MVTYALDASAVIQYLDDESGAARVAEIIKGHLNGRWNCIISAVHWGEIAGVVYKAHGRMGLDLAMNRLLAFGLEVDSRDRRACPKSGPDQSGQEDSIRRRLRG